MALSRAARKRTIARHGLIFLDFAADGVAESVGKWLKTPRYRAISSRKARISLDLPLNLK